MCKTGAARGEEREKVHHGKRSRRVEEEEEEEGTRCDVGGGGGVHGTPCAALVLHAFRMATGFTVPSQGRRGTAPLNQLCHFYARRLIFVEFYYLQYVCALLLLFLLLFLRARALRAYVGGPDCYLSWCECWRVQRVTHFPEKRDIYWRKKKNWWKIKKKACKSGVDMCCID